MADLSQREFVATYGNRLDAVTREQKALKDGSVPRTEIEAQLAALKAENQAMRVDGQAAIDAISAENAELKTRLAAQPASPAPAVLPPAYGPQAGGYDARARSSQSGAAPTGDDPQGGMISSPGEVKLMSFSSDKAATNGLRVGRPDAPPVTAANTLAVQCRNDLLVRASCEAMKQDRFPTQCHTQRGGTVVMRWAAAHTLVLAPCSAQAFDDRAGAAFELMNFV